MSWDLNKSSMPYIIIIIIIEFNFGHTFRIYSSD